MSMMRKNLFYFLLGETMTAIGPFSSLLNDNELSNDFSFSSYFLYFRKTHCIGLLKIHHSKRSVALI